MRFSDVLNEKENPEWKYFYINYSELKEMLYDGIAKAPKITNTADIGRFDYGQYAARFDNTFFKMCAQELDKINKFYKEKLREVCLKFHHLKSDAEIVQAGYGDGPEDPHGKFRQKLLRTFGKKSRSLATEEGLKQSFTDVYIELISLSKYQELNYTGFRKILKKHDKLFGNTVGIQMLRDKVDTAFFHTNKKVEKLVEETELIVTTVFEGGVRAKAMKHLRVPQRDEKINAWTAFKLGLMVGIVLVLFTVFAVSGIIDPTNDGWRIVIRFYRAPAVLDLYLCLLGVNIYFWKQRGINHVYIFDLDPRDNLVHHHFWNIAAVFGCFWAISIVLFLNAKNIGLPPYVAPFGLLAVQALFILNPFPCLYWSSRKWILKIMLRIFTAPFHRVTFADFWMADQLSSLISLVLDYQFMICFFTHPAVFEVLDGQKTNASRLCFSLQTNTCGCDSTKSPYRPSIRALPSVLRMVQCFRRFYDTPLPFPHLANAGKYFLSLLQTTVSAVHVVQPSQSLLSLWIACSIASSLYSFYWDVRMDWGLWEVRADHRFLRSDLLYSYTGYYYAAICSDFILRFSWAMSLSLTEMGFVRPDIMLTITTPAEIFRRFVWNCFRLENEQINNNNAQRVGHPLMAPSVTSVVMTEEQQVQDLLALMDSADGIEKNRTQPTAIRSSLFSFSSLDLKQESTAELYTKFGSVEDIKTTSGYSSNEHLRPRTFRAKCKAFFCCWKNKDK